MSKKLKGTSGLSIDNVPKSGHKLGLLDSPQYQTKSFRLSSETVNILEELTERFCSEANFKIAMGKVVELAIHHIRNMSLKELLQD